MKIELKNIDFSYNDVKILENFNLIVNEGECVCLVGESGCGKTTVARLILGLEKPQNGEVIAPEKLSCVFQEDRLLEHLTLKKNVIFPLQDPLPKVVDSIITDLGLSQAKNYKISNLSGGMKRRTAIARAIAYNGDAIVLDEPFNGLDEANKKAAARLIREYFITQGKPVLLITHIEEDAMLLNAKQFLMKKI